MYKAIKRAVATGELYLDLYTDSDIVTNQLLNNMSICEPIHATYHALTVAELAKVKAWSIQHVHREVNKSADNLATAGRDRGTADEVLEHIPLPTAMPLCRPSSHMLNCVRPCTNIHVRLETWSSQQLNTCEIQSWEVQAVVAWLKSGGAPGEDGVCDAMIRAGGEPMVDMLVLLFRECWAAGHTPARWNSALVRMLHKRNTTQDVNNYRGISLLDIMGKLYEKVCANRAMAMQVHLADGQGIHAEQMGFNPGHSADDALYSMLEGIKHNRNLGHKVIALSLDAKKAYPSMSRGRMLKCVRDMGYGGNLFQAMSSTYDNNTSAILGGQPGEQSTQYLVKDGLREGAVLSPMLYNIFVASLITELKKTGNLADGMHVGGIWAGAQTWADDIVIATADRDLKAARAKMTRLMEVTKKWAADNGVTFSTDESEGKGKGKSKVLTFGHAAIQKKWPLGTETDEFKYLGTTINKNLTCC